MVKLISAFPEWGEYRLIAVAEDGTVYTLQMAEDRAFGEWVKMANGIPPYWIPPATDTD